MLIQGIIFTFIFGAIIGSFLNVVILRYNTGRKLDGRSGCMRCGYQLKWYDLIPIFSWLSLFGKCRKCNSKISIQYPLVELFTGLLFSALFYSLLPLIDLPMLAATTFTFNAVIFSILIIIFVYDFYHKIIPDELSFTFAGLALAQAVYVAVIGGVLNTTLILNLSAGILMFFPFWALWYLSKGTWIGLGDGKLALGIGWYLGFVHGASAIILAFWIGAIFALGFMLVARLCRKDQNITMKYEIPFAPFLILGTLIEFFWRIDVIGLGLFI